MGAKVNSCCINKNGVHLRCLGNVSIHPFFCEQSGHFFFILLGPVFQRGVIPTPSFRGRHLIQAKKGNMYSQTFPELIMNGGLYSCLGISLELLWAISSTTARELA